MREQLADKALRLFLGNSVARTGIAWEASATGMELRQYLRVLFRYWWLVLIVFVIALGFTAWFTFSQVPIYESSASFIVRPTLSAEDAKSELSGLDVLGRQGDIASTFAEMANSRQIKDKAAERLGISSSQRKSLSVDSQLVAGTYLLKITVQGPDPELIRDFANMVGDETIGFVEELYVTYELVTLDPATAPSSPSKPNKILNLALGAALGLVLGGAMAFLAYYLQSPLGAASDVAPAQTGAGRAVPAEIPASPAAPAQAPASYAGAVDEPASHALPAEGPAAFAVAAQAAASDAGKAVEAPAAGAPQESVSAPRSVALGSLFRQRSLLRWIGAALLTLMLMVGASVVWFSGRDTSAATLPTEAPASAVALTAAWTPTAVVLPTDTATEMAVLSATATLEPPATPTTEPSAIPTTEPSATQPVEATATPNAEPSATPTTEPSATATSSPTASATAVPSRTPASLPSPTPRPTEAAVAPTRAAGTSTLSPAPVLLGPLDRQDFSPDAEIVLTWQPVGTLAADAYYAITVSYSHLGETWFDDVPWTRSTSWTLTEHSYLQDLSDNGQYRWSVQVVRQTGTDPNGKPTGVPLSAPSEERMLTWRKESSGGGSGGGVNTPAPPPP